MKQDKYFDYSKEQPINLDKDGCKVDEWKAQSNTLSFAIHPSGFKIFLLPHEVAVSDEYAQSDPYSVELNIQSDFHQIRIKSTLELIKGCIENHNNKYKILDLGCGQGHITARIKDSYPNTEVSGLDYSVSAINYANEKFSSIDFIVGNAYKMPYSENYFDIVVCNNMWEHVPDPLYLLKKISKILKPSGFLIISTPSRYRLANLIRVMMGKPVTFMSQNHVTEYSVGQVIEQLSYGNYTIKQIYSKKTDLPTIKGKTAHMFFSFMVSLLRSHHKLEPTVFFLAQKIPKDL